MSSPAARFTFLAFHGNASNIATRSPTYEFLHDTPGNILALEYRGYGHSEGKPSETVLRVRVNISTRTECKDEVRLALVARLEDNTTDRMTDYRIEKSDLFSPVSEQMGTALLRYLLSP